MTDGDVSGFGGNRDIPGKDRHLIREHLNGRFPDTATKIGRAGYHHTKPDVPPD